MRDFDTICAIATPIGEGGIAIIRVSGENALEIVSKVFRAKSGTDIKNMKSYTMKYGHIYDGDDLIDEVIISYMKGPRSFTAEDVVEINCHGGVVSTNKVLESIIKAGARIAEPGEFTKRAFLNGRIDLAQAESIMDMINAKTEKEAKASLSQLEGKLSENIHVIQKQLLDIMADIEASIDYPEYDVEETTNEKAMRTLNGIKEKLIHLESSFEEGKILKDGVKTVIIVKPNEGKSSLLNIMLNEERAIVSDLAGTTRDTIEEFIKIRGIPIKIIDTAGIRETENMIESIGVKKAISLIDDADLVIAVFDSSKMLEEEDYRILDLIKNKKRIVLLNKCDLRQNNTEMINYMSQKNKTVIEASMRSKKGVEELYSAIEKMFNVNEIEIGNETIITNIRHKNQIHKAIQSIENAINTDKQELPIDIIAVEIKEALENLGCKTGDNVSEDIINEIFSKFCLGK